MGYCVYLLEATVWIDHDKLAAFAKVDGYDDPFKYLEDAEESGWVFHFDHDGNVDDVAYIDEKLGPDTIGLFERLGPIVSAGSVVVLSGEDGATMTFSFDGQRCTRRLTWVDDEDRVVSRVHPYWGEPGSGHHG